MSLREIWMNFLPLGCFGLKEKKEEGGGGMIVVGNSKGEGYSSFDSF